MGKDPNRIKPKPKGNLTIWDILFWGLVFLLVAGLAGGVTANNRQGDPDPGKPVPHSTISPEGVKPLK